MTPRRKFIQQIGLAAVAFSASSLFNQLHAAEWELALQKVKSVSPETLAADEDFWAVIQQSFTISPNIINLNNGGVSPRRE
jgi:hypothetical protein